MAAVVIKGFAGMRPAINPRLLETGEAQQAKNAKLNNGSLRAMKSALTVKQLPFAVQTIFRYGDEALDNQYWLTFAGDVDVMKSPVHSDQYRRVYWTDGSLPKYAPESVLLSSEPYPTASYTLGIPKPGVALTATGSAVPVYTQERREYVVTFTSATEETAPSTAFVVTAVDTFAVKITGIPVPASGSSYTGKKLYRRDANVNGSTFKLVASLATSVTEYTDEVANANLGATLSTSNISAVPVPSAPVASHDPVTLTAGAVTRYYAYTYGGYYDVQLESYVEEAQLSSVASVSVDSTQSVTLSNFSAAPGGATYRRIYRRDSASGSFFRIAQIPVNQTTYVDSTLTATGTGPSYSTSVLSLSAPTLTASASTAISNDTLTTFVYCATYVTASGVEGKRSAESNAVKVIDGVTQVTITGKTAPEGVDKVKVYRRIATVTNGVLGGSDADYRLLTTVPATQTSGVDATPSSSIASNDTLPLASRGSSISPTSVFASGTIPAPVIPETRIYVYTYVSAYDEEGPPSDASTSIDIDPANPVTLSGMATAPAGSYNITKKRIYRSSTGNQSTAFQFVAEVPVANSSYTDSIEQADLGEVLPSEGWVAPPSTMQGLTLGANGIAIGFVDKTVHVSEAFLPHAWPAKYQQTTEHKVVGVASFQQSFAVLTTSYPYILTGADPASMSMTKLEAPQACVSKRSICPTGTGVVYASPDGLVSIATDGIKLLTHGLLNREQWQAYTPSSMLIRQYNSKIYVFHSTGLLVFDFTGESASMTVFDQTASAAYYDPISDSLFITDPGWILKWDSGNALTYTWKSKLLTLPQSLNFAFAQVEADVYPVTCKIYAGGTLRHTQTVTARNPFRLPSGFVEKDWEVQLEGTSQVFQVSLSQTIHEMRSA